MIRLGAVLAALCAALLTAPAAFAATFTVNDPGSGTGNPCLPAQPGCTLPSAIQDSNTTPGADTINFTGAGTAAGPFATALPTISDPVVIDGGGNTSVTFSAAAAGPLVNVAAATTSLKAMTVSGGASGVTVNLAGSGDRLDSVTISKAPGNAIAVSGPNATIATTTVTSAAGRGIDITGSGTAVSSPEISGAGSTGIVAGGSGASISGGHIHNNANDGVLLGGQNDRVSQVVFYGNGGKPIATPPGANGGIAPPQSLRIGPRRADGSLPLTGNANGSVELWSGNPSSSNPPAFLTAFGASGDFTYNFPSEPAPGSVFAASQTGNTGTSEFATVAVPADVVSPDAGFARALDTGSVRVDFTEPLDPASVTAQDFKLSMAGADRAISGVAVDPSGRFVTLTSSGWKAGEAGYVEMTSVGAVNDSAGNAMLSAPRLRVAAAPGDFVAPLGAKLTVTPKTICLTRGRGCRKPGMTIKFASTEPGKARLLIKRSNKTVGSRLYSSIVAGPNTLKFNGRLASRKLRVGRYRLLMYIQDQVGNITDQPPIVLFNVRRTTK